MQPGIMQVIQCLKDQGCRVRPTKGGVFIYLPDGVTTLGFHVSKASDRRTMKNIRSDVRRAGLEWPKGLGGI